MSDHALQHGEYDFRTFRFGSGCHVSRESGMCIMEAVAYVAGERHSDAPECASPVISALLRRFNDGLDDEHRRVLLAQFVFRMVGTRGTPEIEQQRAWMAADWTIRVGAPMFLGLVPSLAPHAKELRGLAPVSPETASVARAKVFAARSASGAVYWAAEVAAVEAAVEVSVAAAAVAAEVEVEEAVAAVSAAVVAAAVAVEAASKTSGRTADRRATIERAICKSQESLVDLVDSMIKLTEIQEPATASRAKRRRSATEAPTP